MERLGRTRGLVLSLLTAMLWCATGCRHGQARHDEDFRSVIQQAQEKVFPALVFIKPIKEQLGTGERIRRQVFGSGVIITPDGLVVTNSHVARNSTQIKCVLSDRRQLPARVVGVDVDTDLALLRLELPPNHAPVPAATLGDSTSLKEGQFVMALGSPFGFTRSISFGIISCTRRYLDVGPYSLWIQTDAAINPGNSGGPLVNDRGDVIGINTLKVSYGENIGFAIPADTVRRVVEQLRRKGRVERSYTGIQFQPIKDFVRDVVLEYDTGVLVRGVDEGSPAARAGLKAGDLILSCRGNPVRGIYLEDLPRVRSTLASLRPDAPVPMTVRRGAREMTVQVKPTRKLQPSEEGLELPMWNCSAQAISKSRTPMLHYFTPRAVYILGVRKPGNAHASGLRSGDVVLSIDREPIPTLEALAKVYRRLTRLEREKRTALLEILRRGYRLFVVIDFKRDYRSGG